MSKRPNIGGQAVIEGVMMRAPSKFVIAVRKSEDEIVLKKEEVKLDTNKFFKQPLIRGLIALYDALILGIRALNFSAYHSTGEGEEHVGKWAMFFSMATGIGLGLLLFIYLPLQVTELSKYIIPQVETSALLYNGIDGVVRVIFFIIYVWAISFLKDIKRVFQYHGAEHMAIYTYEQGLDLTVENAREQSRFHPRCGTSFFDYPDACVYTDILAYTERCSLFFIKLGARLVFFIPVIAGVSYEILKLSGKYFKNPIVKILILPGLLVQKITTQEPDDSQLEVALISIRASLDMEIPEEGITIIA